MKNRSIIGLTVALVVAITGVVAPTFADTSGSWVPQLPNQNDPSFHSVTFEDPLPMQFNFSLLQATDSNSMFAVSYTHLTLPTIYSV